MREGEWEEILFYYIVLYECFLPRMAVVPFNTEHLLCARSCANWFMCVNPFNPLLSPKVDTKSFFL